MRGNAEAESERVRRSSQSGRWEVVLPTQVHGALLEQLLCARDHFRSSLIGVYLLEEKANNHQF